MSAILAISAMAMKDLRLLVRDRMSVFFTFAFPVMFAIFFGLVFGSGGGSKLEVAIVDEDASEASAAFVESLKGDEALNVKIAATRDSGESMVRHDEAAALVVIPKGFDRASSDLFVGGRMKLEAVVAPGRKAEAGLLQGKLNQMAFVAMSGTFSDPKRMRASLDKARDTLRKNSEMPPAQRLLFEAFFSSVESLSGSLRGDSTATTTPENQAQSTPGTTTAGGWQPVDVSIREIEFKDKRPTSAFQVSFPQGVVWGLMGCVTAFGASLAAERTAGTLVRLLTAPIARWHVLAGKAMACFITSLLVVAILLGVLSIFGLRVARWETFIAAVLASAFGFVGVMMVVAALSRSEGGAAGAGRAVVLVLAMIGGGTIPLFAMPESMKVVSSVSPFKWAVVAIEGGLWRDLPISGVAMPLLVLVAIGLAGFAGGAMMFKWTGKA